MKKLKYIKLYEQYRMNEEIFGLFGKKTEPNLPNLIPVKKSKVESILESYV
jgi:hypothetical protein